MGILVAWFSGWVPALWLLGATIAIDGGCWIAKGRLAAFVFVTYHFVVMPVAAIVCIASTVVGSVRGRRDYRENPFLGVVSIVIPGVLLYSALSGNISDLMQFLHVSFKQ